MPPKSASKTPSKTSRLLNKPSSPAKVQPRALFKEEIDLQALVNNETALADAISNAKKRKAKPAIEISSDSSDVEIVEAPVTPSKKRTRTTPPSPGTPEFVSLPAVSLTGERDEAMAGGTSKGATFGSIQPISEGRPKRAVVKTAKALANSSAGSVTAPRSAKALFKTEPSTPPVPPNDEISQLISQLPYSKGKDKAKALSASPAAASPSPLPEEEDDAEAQFKELASWEGSQADTYEKSGKPACVDEEIVGPLPSDDGANANPDHSDMEDQINEGENSQDDCNADSGVDPLSVMYPPCQDPLLVEIYRGLPTLPRLYEVKAFTGSVDSLRTPFKDSCENLSKSEVGSFLKALTFCQSSQYVNTARINPALLYVDGSRLRVKENKSLAICIMTGTLTESYLIGSAEAGPRHAPYAIHKVTIAPLEQEMRRDMSAWGLLFDFPTASITGMMSPAGFGFATRGEGKGDGWGGASAPPSPVKSKTSVLRSVSSLLPSLAQDSSYSASRSFSDPVPVYDGRARNGNPPFTFSDADFKRLSTWPLYKKGTAEIPVDSIVSVGYTLGTYKGTAGPVLSSNIQFAILLATPL